jgi:ABC-type nitrate/sulfonate/bicarbonate transport system permease component
MASAAPHARTAPRPMPQSVRVIVPIIVGVLFVAAWEGLVRYLAIPRFVLPPPSMIVTALVDDFFPLVASAWVTLKVGGRGDPLRPVAAL